MTARIPYPLDRATVDAVLIDVRHANAEGGGLTLALAAHAAPARLIGLAGISDGSAGGAPHLGYWLGRPYQGSGLMSEAVAALVHAHFVYAGAACLAAEARLDNPASRRVLDRVGMVETGHCVRDVPLRGRAHAVACYRLDRTAWVSLQGAYGVIAVGAA